MDRLARRATIALAATLALASLPAGLAAQQRVLIPEGTVLTVTTDQALSSRTLEVGAEFSTTVTDSVRVDRYAVIPRGSRIFGEVTAVRRADDRDSGVLGVEFTSLRLPDGSSIPMEGKLTSTDPAERRQIEARGDAQVVLVGGRQGVGATIGAIGGAEASDPVSGILGALGALLSEGADVQVPAGTTLAVQLQRPLVLTATSAPARAPDAFTLYTSAEAIRASQTALRERGYYRGAVDGELTDATRRALLAFQIDQGILATGNLDGRTARALDLRVGAAVALSTDEASYLRRNALSLVQRWRAAIGIASNGRMSASRHYSEPEIDLYFALSAFADNAGLYEQTVLASGNVAGLSAASGALVDAARDVDSAIEAADPPARTVATWRQMRSVLGTVEAGYPED